MSAQVVPAKGSPVSPSKERYKLSRERSMSLAESVLRNGFVHGEQAREVRKINKRFTFDHIDDITSGPGLFDTVFPPLFEENSLLQVTASEQGYAFAVKCSINVKVQQLLKIDIPNNTFTVRLKVTTHWIVPMEHVGSYYHFFEKFKPEVILLNRVGTFGGINSDLYTDADIKRQTVRPRLITEPSKDKLEKRKEDQMKKSVLAHFSITADKTAELRQSFELHEFPFDNQALGIWFYAKPIQIWGRLLKIEFEHPMLVLGGARNEVGRDADWIGDYDISALLAQRIKNEQGLCDKYVVTIFVYRDPTAFSINVIFPVMITILLSSSAYWVDPCSLADRLSVTLTLFLTQAAFMVVVKQQLPVVPYLTPIEKIIVGLLLLMSLQCSLFMRVRGKCLRDEDVVDGPGGDYFLFGLDPQMLVNSDDGLRATRGTRYTKTSGAKYDLIGLGLTVISFVAALLYLYLTHNWAKKYRKKFAQAARRGENPDDLDSEDAYHAFIMKASRIKVRSDAFANDAIKDADHVSTAYRFHEKMIRSRNDDDNNNDGGGGGSDDEPELDTKSHGAIIFDCGTGATKALLVVAKEEEFMVVEPDNMDFASLSEEGDVNRLLEYDLKAVCKENFPDDVAHQKRAEENLSKLLAINGIKNVDDLHAILQGTHREPFIENYKKSFPSDKQKDNVLPLKLWLDLEKVSDPQVSRTKAIRKGDSRSALHFFEDCVKRIKNSQKYGTLKESEKEKFQETHEVAWTGGDKKSGVAWTGGDKKSGDKSKIISIPKDCTLKVVLGVSHWYRASFGKPLHTEQKLLIDGILKQHPDWVVERLTDLDECWYEMRAVQYAWKMYRRQPKWMKPEEGMDKLQDIEAREEENDDYDTMDDLQQQLQKKKQEEKESNDGERLQGVLGVGSGSTQYSAPALDIVYEYVAGIQHKKDTIKGNAVFRFKDEFEDREKKKKELEKKEEELHKKVAEIEKKEKEQMKKKLKEEKKTWREEAKGVLEKATDEIAHVAAQGREMEAKIEVETRKKIEKGRKAILKQAESMTIVSQSTFVRPATNLFTAAWRMIRKVDDGTLQEAEYQKYADARTRLESENNFTPTMLGAGNKSGMEEILAYIKNSDGTNLDKEGLKEKVGKVRKKYGKGVQAWAKATFQTKKSEQNDDEETSRKISHKMPYLENYCVILISANYYAAEDAGITDSEDPLKNPPPTGSPTKPYTVRNVLKIFDAKIKENTETLANELAKLLKGKDAFNTEDLLAISKQKNISKLAKAISNMSYLHELYDAIFEPKVRVRFCRNWQFQRTQLDSNGDEIEQEKYSEEHKEKTFPFRTTWSAGWFIDHKFDSSS